jgi:histidinol-phosphate aminotransferase
VSASWTELLRPHRQAYHLPRPTGVQVRLDANESPFQLPDEVARSICEALTRLPLHRYPDPAAEALKHALASWSGLPASALVVGNGSDEIIGLLAGAISVPRPGQARARLAFASPSFVMYRLTAAAMGLDPVEIPLDDAFQLDADTLERVLVDSRPNLVFLAWPNNPTGTLWRADVIADAASRHQDTIFVVDEAYHEYCGATLSPLVSASGNVVIMRTLSKIGLAALRVGYAAAPTLIHHALEAQRAPYNVSATSQAIATIMLGEYATLLRDQTVRVVTERHRLGAALRTLPGVRLFPSSANFVLVRVADAARVWQALVDRGVLVRNLHASGPLAGCLRITVGTSADTDALLEAWPS